MKNAISWVFTILILGSSYSYAETILPVSLDKSDRVTMLSILGFGTTPKLISNPYPLGGYKGWELGLSSEFLSMEEIAGLGVAPSGKVLTKGDFNFYNLSFSKGLFENVDTTLSFLPSLQGEGVSGMGFQLRWAFYESPYMPMALSTNIYGGSVNIQSLLGSDSLGADLLCTMSLEDIALYFGFGYAKVIGHFTGGSSGITDDNERHVEAVSSSHSLFGLSFQVSKMLFAFQVDRYRDPVYGAKIGFRF